MPSDPIRADVDVDPATVLEWVDGVSQRDVVHVVVGDADGRPCREEGELGDQVKPALEATAHGGDGGLAPGCPEARLHRRGVEVALDGSRDLAEVDP